MNVFLHAGAHAHLSNAFSWTVEALYNKSHSSLYLLFDFVDLQDTIYDVLASSISAELQYCRRRRPDIDET